MPAQHSTLTQTIAKDYKTGLCLELTIQFHARIGLRYSAAQTTSKEPNCTAAVQSLHSHLSYIDVKLPGIGLVNNVLDKSFVWQHKYIGLIFDWFMQVKNSVGIRDYSASPQVGIENG